EKDLKDGDLVELKAGTRGLTLPILVQPGQAAGSFSLALGYGRRTGSVAKDVGADAYPLMQSTDGLVLQIAEITKTDRHVELARSQRYDLLGDKRSHDKELIQIRNVGEKSEHGHGHAGKPASLYEDKPYPGPKWAMVVDLNSCVGCSNCVVACQAENNVPVVGAEQVAKGREMHWIRLDRYYQGELENPGAAFQPVMCQQCDNAPCESVCPVSATTHSPDGLNQMTYNRCVGTRYCSNNCPYKVRRFNFFDYTGEIAEPQEMVFNPEVTVRPRGVMEKCTFCVQRISDAKWTAKKEGRPVAEGEVKTACQASCPANAIHFGDINNPEHSVGKMAADERGYRILEELNVRPAVTYLARLSNQPKGGAA
ncbi:MAG: 4Fe-4S dicluster domain-containing protein, partial [Prosthecobacter sp.]|nr:4Fe-4S dicluster domain-containing protein [Prosthecobacter sp.]